MEYLDKSEFVEYGGDFSYDNKQVLDSDVLVVLDSSFDPPNLAHLALVKTAVEYHRSKSPGKSLRFSILLLLATSNADKRVSSEKQEAEIKKRWSLVKAFEQDVKEQFDGESSITFTKGLINAALFVDKYRILRQRVPRTRLTFVMGYDTLMRLMDPKYYKSERADETHVLYDFFHDPACRIVVLTRKPDGVSNTPAALTDDLDAQTNVLRLVEGSGVENWRPELIHMIKIFKSTSDTEGVSSSVARKMIKDNDPGLDKVVPSHVLNYITNSGLYK